MTFQVTDELLTIVVTDPVLVEASTAALQALGDAAGPGRTIRGADLQGAPAASLAKAWQALHDTLEAIQRPSGPARRFPRHA